MHIRFFEEMHVRHRFSPKPGVVTHPVTSDIGRCLTAVQLCDCGGTLRRAMSRLTL